MNNKFSPRRFAKYFVYDLINAKNQYLFSLLVLGLFPVLVFVVVEMFSLIFNDGITEYDSSMRMTAMAVAIVAVVISFPTKVYGGLTERKSGSEWILVPASVTEKWLSMVAIMCIALPICFFALLLGSDLLMSVLFKNTYGAFPDNLDFIKGFMNGLIQSNLPIKINMPVICFLNWCENILVFTLGAVIFKKAKVGKTILSMVVIGSFLTIVTFVIFGNVDFLDRDVLMNFDAEKALRTFNLLVSSIYIVVFAVLLGGLWMRLRTIKH